MYCIARTSNLVQRNTATRSLQMTINHSGSRKEKLCWSRTAACTLNQHKANKGLDVLICISATRCFAMPDKMYMQENLFILFKVKS